MKKKLARFASLFAVVALCFSWMCVPALAEALSGTGGVYVAVDKTSDFATFSADEVEFSCGEFSSVKLSSVYESTGASSRRYVGLNAFTPGLFKCESNVILSISYYLENGTLFTGSGTASGLFVNIDGVEESISADLTRFEPGGTSDIANRGVTVVGTFSANPDNPISNPRLSWSPAFSYTYADYYASNKTVKVNVRITSCRVICSTASSADVEELKNIASAIAEQNDILQGMYGDILAVCNAIYERNGSILEAQQLANQYFEAIIPVLNSISTNTANIYNALGTYFDLVLKAIDNQTLTLEEAIQDAELALETYLKPIVDYFNELEETTGESASSLPSHKTDLDGWASDSSGIDADAQTGLAAILPVFTAFGFVFSILGIFIGLGVFMLIIKKGLS